MRKIYRHYIAFLIHLILNFTLKRLVHWLMNYNVPAFSHNFKQNRTNYTMRPITQHTLTNAENTCSFMHNLKLIKLISVTAWPRGKHEWLNLEDKDYIFVRPTMKKVFDVKIILLVLHLTSLIMFNIPI